MVYEDARIYAAVVSMGVNPKNMGEVYKIAEQEGILEWGGSYKDGFRRVLKEEEREILLLKMCLERHRENSDVRVPIEVTDPTVKDVSVQVRCSLDDCL